MQVPVTPADEGVRIDTLRALKVLDTPPEERFDRLTRLAKRLFGVPIALVSLVDTNRQWFKSCIGLDATETPREISFCGHAIVGEDIFLIPDAARDERFCDNPLVLSEPCIRFYAGCPLTVAGSRLGTLCIIDREPREFTDEDVALLHDLARMVEHELAAVQMATIDELTLISNRRGFEALAWRGLALCRRLGKSASMVFFDLDLFKQINDRYGHAEGDRALVSFARLLREAFRDSDVIGRLGGDEFAVLMTNVGKGDIAPALARLQQAVEAYNRTAQRGYDLCYSVGAVEFDAAHHVDIAALVADADALMYEQKAQRSSSRICGPEFNAPDSTLAWVVPK